MSMQHIPDTVPVGDVTVPALLHLPPEAAADAAVPAIVLYPGMDMIKEYLPVPGRNVFAARGMAVLVLDAPGHGDSNLRGIKLTGDNAELAGRSAVDLLSARADIDERRIGAFGIGTGGYFAISLAAGDPRLAATVGGRGADNEGPSLTRPVRLIRGPSVLGVGVDGLLEACATSTPVTSTRRMVTSTIRRGRQRRPRRSDR